jgi:hypothetical protein
MSLHLRCLSCCFNMCAQVQMTLTPVAKRAYGLKPGEEPAGGLGWLGSMMCGLPLMLCKTTRG